MLEENNLESVYCMASHFKDCLGGAKKKRITRQERCMAELQTLELSLSSDQEHH